MYLIEQIFQVNYHVKSGFYTHSKSIFTNIFLPLPLIEMSFWQIKLQQE